MGRTRMPWTGSTSSGCRGEARLTRGRSRRCCGTRSDRARSAWAKTGFCGAWASLFFRALCSARLTPRRRAQVVGPAHAGADARAQLQRSANHEHGEERRRRAPVRDCRQGRHLPLARVVRPPPPPLPLVDPPSRSSPLTTLPLTRTPAHPQPPPLPAAHAPLRRLVGLAAPLARNVRDGRRGRRVGPRARRRHGPGARGRKGPPRARALRCVQPGRRVLCERERRRCVAFPPLLFSRDAG